MRTEDLIATLAADTKPAQSPARALALAIAIGAVPAAVLFYIVLGPRPDFLHAISTLRFDFKFVVTLSLAATAFVLALRLARPDATANRAVLLAVPVLLAVAVVLELVSVPAQDWLTRWIGHNARACVLGIPFLSLLPLAAILAALRQGAVTRPRLAGAVAGLLAAGIGATFYAAHCPDDSPLFVATWYTLAALFMAGVGALLGSRLLRW
jgi:hypothetical protein